MKNSNVILAVISVFAIGTLGFIVFLPQVFMYQFMGAEGMHGHMVKTREHGIKMAKENGDYRCCIEPDCTMCYSEGNKWNYGIAGTCGCDDFIAKGEEPCPQCARALSCDGTSQEISEEPATCTVDFEE